MSSTHQRPQKRMTAARMGLYFFLMTSALFFLLPLYIMLVTSFKSMEEIRMGNIFALPLVPTLEPWITAWTSACTGVACEGIQGGFWNSLLIVIPNTRDLHDGRHYDDGLGHG